VAGADGTASRVVDGSGVTAGAVGTAGVAVCAGGASALQADSAVIATSRTAVRIGRSP
jgi:hypothetical protein